MKGMMDKMLGGFGGMFGGGNKDGEDGKEGEGKGGIIIYKK